MRHARPSGFAAILASACLMLAALAALLLPPHAQAESESADVPEISTIAELDGKRIGMLSGVVFDRLMTESLDGTYTFSYYNSIADMVAALKSGRIDTFVDDEPVVRLAIARNEGLALMPETFMDDDYGFAFPKGSPLVADFDRVIEALRADGTLDALEAKWTGADESVKVLPTQDWEAPNGTLVMAVDDTSEPMCYVSSDGVVGYNCELGLLIARELGYRLKINSMPWSSMLAAIQSGKADFGGGNVSITDERKEVMDFSVPDYYGSATFAVRAASSGAAGSGDADGGFLGALSSSFERTFLVEDRYQLILGGLGVTLLISLASGALGMLLGFALVMLRRGGNRLAATLIDSFEGLLGGLPVVVVLMVFYYVVFGAFDVSGVLVGILVFTLIFGAAAGSIMWNSVRAVDSGQNEAGRALGFSDRKTFFLIVFPQAARNFLPLLRGQFVSLVKDTSVVGYIAVQDLTRAGDLIRSRTMEAFFPLVATAIIYFVLCRLLAWLLDRFIRRFEPVKGPRTIKGVEL